MNIVTQLIPVGTKRRSGYKLLGVKFFVDHDTGNPNSTARGNVKYYIDSRDEMSASAHAFIDDVEVRICVPCLENPEKAWHVRYDMPLDNSRFGDDANDIAIGMELCYFPADKERSLKAYNNYVEFAAYLAKFHNVDPANRIGHYELDPTRRSDPNNALSYIGKSYKDMVQDIIVKYKELYVKETITKMEKAWQQESGEKALDGLAAKGLVNNADSWKQRDLLNEPVPLWLFFEMLNRIIK